MEFQTKLKELSKRVELLKPGINTEEATKTSLIMPFIQMLGYDIFNPMEVVPEYTADWGIKKGEKVDYAILRDGNPIMIIECKHWEENLDVHKSQLYRYFNVTSTRFGILTNGIEYRFYSDLEKGNDMDGEPFFTFNLENLKENVFNELRKFSKESFDVERMVDSASELKYTSLIKALLAKELEEPDEEFIRFFGKKVYSGKLTARALEQMSGLVKKATNQYIRELVNDRLQAALKKEEDVLEVVEEVIEKNKIETTEDELEGFMIVKSILRLKGEVAKINYRDNQRYFAIYYDKQTQPICRLHFNRNQKYIGLIDKEKREERLPIACLDDIFEYSERMIQTLEQYIETVVAE